MADTANPQPVTPPPARPKTVIVVGGGVGGLTAAHELAERGFQVTVVETRDILGGKARSVELPDTAQNGSAPLPGEHGFRFLPACYFHLPETMTRIPRRDGTAVAQHLVPAQEILFATYDNLPFSLPLGFSAEKFFSPGGLKDQAIQLWKLIEFLPGLLRLEEHGTFLTAGDLAFYTGKLWEILTTCRERRLAKFENVPWWKFLDAEARSHAYQKYLAIGLTRNLVACKAEKANTLTIGQIAVQMVLSILNPKMVDRVLDGPTNDVWINPWRDYLANPADFPGRPAAFKHPVRFVMGKELAEITFDNDTNTVAGIKVRAASRRIHRVRRKVHDAIAAAERDPDIIAVTDVWKRNSLIFQRAHVARLAAEAAENANPEPHAPLEDARADAYVFALPVEQIAGFITHDMARADPHLNGLQTLSTQVDWMAGIQYYLTHELKVPAGHVDFLDTEWALTSIAQDQRLWSSGLDRFGDGTVKHILSVDISDWSAPDPRNREAWDLPPLEIAREVWRQLQQSLNHGGSQILRDDMMHPRYRWYLDDDIDERMEPHRRQSAATNGKPDLLVNAEPLLVNLAGSRRLRPDAVTGIKNMFLASDYVLTNTELATMEGANEAARHAVNGILKLTSSASPTCVTKPFNEPLAFLRALDKWCLDKHLNWNLGLGKVALTAGTHVAVNACRILVAAKNRVFPPPPTPVNLPPSSPLRAPGPAGPKTAG